MTLSALCLWALAGLIFAFFTVGGAVTAVRALFAKEDKSDEFVMGLGSVLISLFVLGLGFNIAGI